MIWWQRRQLGSKNPAVRRAAVEKLSTLASPNAIAPLLEALSVPDLEVRKLALKALKRFNDPSMPGPVLKVCADPDPALRAEAVHLLEHLNWRPSSAAERAWQAVGMGELRRAATCGVEAVPVLVLVLRAGPSDRSVAAIEALSVVGGQQALPPLQEAIKHPGGNVRAAAVEAIGRVGDPAAAVLLLPLLKDPEVRVRAVVVEALGRLGRSGEEIIPMLDDASWEVRRAAIISLGALREPSATSRLAKLLEDQDRDLREAAAMALGSIGDERAVGPLVLGLLDPESHVRRSAEFALGRINRHWIKSQSVREVLPALQEALKHPEYAVRHGASKLLNQLAPHFPDVESLAGLLVDRAPASDQAVTMLLELLRDDDPDLRFAAVQALQTIDDPRAAEGLEHARFDPDPTVQRAASQPLHV